MGLKTMLWVCRTILPKNLFSYGPMSIPPGTPSEGEREGALSKKKNRPLCRLGWVFKLFNFFHTKKISEMGFGARRGVRENLLVLIHGE